MPVDLDHDGHTEILVPSSGLTGWGAITALTHDGAGWGAAASTWSVQDYNWENVADDGAVPAAPPQPWLNDDVVRACPANPSNAADLVVTFSDTCVFDCVYGPAEVGVQVYNPGGASVEAGAVLEAYADDGLLATEVLPAIDVTTALDAYMVSISVADVPAIEWIVRVTTTAAECDTANNEARTNEAVCP